MEKIQAICYDLVLHQEYFNVSHTEITLSRLEDLGNDCISCSLVKQVSWKSFVKTKNNTKCLKVTYLNSGTVLLHIKYQDLKILNYLSSQNESIPNQFEQNTKMLHNTI